MKGAQGLWAIPLFLSICATTDLAQADEAHSEARPFILLAAREGGGGGTSRMDGIDLPGFDLPNQPRLLPSPFPDMCKASCDNDPRCKAWTYVKPGVQTWISRDKAVCWLKHSVPARKNNPNTISGTKQVPLPPPPEISMTSMENVKFVNAQPYKSFPLEYFENSRRCEVKCEVDLSCYAWSFLRKSSRLPIGDNTCQMYSGYPSSVRDTCCVSGYKKVKGAGPALGQPPPPPPILPTPPPVPPPPQPTSVIGVGMERGWNRPGGDLRPPGGIELPQPWPEVCQKKCLDEPRCRAWTYVKPGVQRQKAMCWLKGSVPNPIPDPNAVSGVKGTPPTAVGPPTPPPRPSPPPTASCQWKMLPGFWGYTDRDKREGRRCECGGVVTNDTSRCGPIP